MNIKIAKIAKIAEIAEINLNFITKTGRRQRVYLGGSHRLVEKCWEMRESLPNSKNPRPVLHLVLGTSDHLCLVIEVEKKHPISIYYRQLIDCWEYRGQDRRSFQNTRASQRHTRVERACRAAYPKGTTFKGPSTGSGRFLPTPTLTLILVWHTSAWNYPHHHHHPGELL